MNLKITIRLDEKTRNELDKQASLNGLSMSAYVKSALSDRLSDAKDKSEKLTPKDSDDRKYKMQFRVTAREREALQIIAKQQNIYMSDVCKKIIFMRLYQGSSSPIAVMESINALRETKNAINKIGVNINQSTRALNASLEQDSGLKIRTIIRSFSPKLIALKFELMCVETQINNIAWEDMRYWRGDA